MTIQASTIQFESPFQNFLFSCFQEKYKKDGELDVVHFHAIGVFVVHFCCLRAWSPRQVHNTSFLKKRCQTSEAFKYWAVFGYSQSQSPTRAQRCMPHNMDRFLCFNDFWHCFLEFHASQNMTTSRHGVRLEKLIAAVREIFSARMEPRCLLSYSSVSQPPGRGPVPAPGINYTGSREVPLEFVILVF